MQTVTINGVNISLDEAAKHENVDGLKALDIFPEGPEQAGAYEALWNSVTEFKGKAVEPKIVVKKGKRQAE